MTALTMEQRRHDFEAMLRRADLARATMPPCRTALTETGGPLAILARDVSELCSAWAESAHRVRTRKPSDQAQARARIVAARCLTLLDDIHVANPVKEVSGASVDEVLGPLACGEDLHVPADERVGRLLAYLGDVAENYNYGTDEDCHLALKDVTALLAAKAICAALAAERGLWQEEES